MLKTKNFISVYRYAIRLDSYSWRFYRNYDSKRLDNSKTHYLIEVEGMDYKDILAQAKARYGKNKYKCQLSRKFVETMGDLGVLIDDKVNLKVYQFSFSHEVFDLRDVILSVRNQKRLISNTEDYCED